MSTARHGSASVSGTAKSKTAGAVGSEPAV